MRIQKRITLGQVTGNFEHTPTFYRVKKLVNSTRYRIGEKLTELATTELCGLPDWTVTIIDGNL